MKKLLLAALALASITSASADFPKNCLIEEFTTEKCGNCPRVAGYLHGVLEDSLTADQKERVAAVCHHVGYYTDQWTIKASNVLTKYYGSGGTWAPSLMFNRTKQSVGGEMQDEIATDPLTPAGMMECIRRELGKRSNYNVEMKAWLDKANPDSLKLVVEVCLVRALPAAQTYLQVYLTEDNLATTTQSGAYGNYTQQHVLRATNGTTSATYWGKKVKNTDFTNNHYFYYYTFDLDPSWKLEDLIVLGISNEYVSTSMAKSPVNNVTYLPSSKWEEVTGIGDVTVEGFENANAPVEYFNLMGQKISNPSAGQLVIRRQGQNVEKTIIR